MFKPRVVIGKNVFNMLQEHVISTGFQYETGGVLLGYKCLSTFYVVACTFPRRGRNVQASKMTFTLDGSEHTKEMERVRQQYIFKPGLIGIWHSHTTEDNSFSAQDMESNGLLVKQIGEMLSVIVIRRKDNSTEVIPYYISKGNREFRITANKKDFNSGRSFGV